jgi:hypothetical protein
MNGKHRSADASEHPKKTKPSAPRSQTADASEKTCRPAQGRRMNDRYRNADASKNTSKPTRPRHAAKPPMLAKRHAALHKGSA